MTNEHSPLTSIINAAGKLTALGGSVQSESVADAAAVAARQHVDLAEQRRMVALKIARLTGAEAACITSGAAAGISISIAAILTGNDLELVRQLPSFTNCNNVLLQSGHAINFGAPIEQMIRLGGGKPWLLGSTHDVPEQSLQDALESNQVAAMLYVKSHHCIQTNQISLQSCLALCHQYDIPLVVDAAAEEDLRHYVSAGADLVIYSGGKAFCGPTSGFIAGKSDLIESCELQSQGIARTMKVGKETIAGLSLALDEYAAGNEQDRLNHLEQLNNLLSGNLAGCKLLQSRLVPDEAGRPFSRIAVSLRQGDINSLVSFLRDARPSIRTRNHHLNEGYLLIDPRELTEAQAHIISQRLLEFDSRQG
jgi:L-seryl-tRNA(Ser) seleniumtransferase/D-glucosaminate-6-phosphate ammonia-lyase